MQMVMAAEIRKIQLDLGPLDEVETEVFWKVLDCIYQMYEAKGIKD